MSTFDENTILEDSVERLESHHSSVAEFNQQAFKDSLVDRKLDWSLLMHDLRGQLKLVAEVLHYAAYDKPEAYGPRNWCNGGEAFIYELKNAIERHTDAIENGEMIDPESGKPHRAHIICSHLFLLYFNT